MIEKLNRLSPRQLRVAADLLTGQFGEARDRRARIALIGLRGAGKTTLGRLLAHRLEVPFIELPKLIEADAGVSLTEIFNLYGHGSYRRYERRALERVLESEATAVLETGGSLVSEPATYERLLDSCFTVWVQASAEEHMNRVIAQGDHRPMAGNGEAMDDLRRILAQREALYARADAVIDTSGRTVEAALDELQDLVRNRNLLGVAQVAR